MAEIDEEEGLRLAMECGLSICCECQERLYLSDLYHLALSKVPVRPPPEVINSRLWASDRLFKLKSHLFYFVSLM